MTDPFNKATIVVNGHEVVLDTKVDLQMGDLSGDMKTIASRMGYWGNVWAAAAKEQSETDSVYRHWRATISEAILETDPKLAEWKVKSRIEAHSDFMKYKKAIALAEHNVILAKATFETLAKKANQLQSRGAMHRSELDATDMYTPAKKTAPKTKSNKTSAPLKTKGAPDPGDHRVSAMRNMFNK